MKKKQTKKNFPQLQIISQWFPTETSVLSLTDNIQSCPIYSCEGRGEFLLDMFSQEMLLGMLQGFLWRAGSASSPPGSAASPQGCFQPVQLGYIH